MGEHLHKKKKARRCEDCDLKKPTFVMPAAKDKPARWCRWPRRKTCLPARSARSSCQPVDPRTAAGACAVAAPRPTTGR